MLRFVLCLSAFFATYPAFAQDAQPTPPDPAALAIAHDILQMAHTVENLKIGLDLATPMMVMQLKRDKADIPDDVIAKFTVAARSEMEAGIPKLLDMEAEILARHYTTAELAALKDFYGTPLGKKLIEQSPLIAKETVPVAQAWGMAAGQEAMKNTLAKLRAQGVKI